jgi:uncharacterized protein (TIGR03083 family)
MLTIDEQDLIAHIERDAAGLLAAARRAVPSAAVPSCPDWDVVDLAWHIGEVHAFWGTIVRDRLQHRDQYVDPDRPSSHDATFDFAEHAAALLLEALRSTPTDTRVWTWSSQNDVAFVLRRMAQETAVHRCDAEAAAGAEATADAGASRDRLRIPAGLAADGIDEFLTHFLPDVVDDPPPLAGSVHLHCTDTEGEWTVALDDDGSYDVARGHAKATAALRGPAHDLLVTLWRRVPLGPPIEVFGETSVAEALIARTDLE